jgi:hypothetical protein
MVVNIIFIACFLGFSAIFMKFLKFYVYISLSLMIFMRLHAFNLLIILKEKK